MHVRHPFGVLQLVVACCLLLASRSDGAQGQSVNIRDGDGPLERCDQLEISFDHRPALRDEETVQVPLGNDGLEVRLTGQGGIALREGSGSQHDIMLCKAVPDDPGADLTAIRAVATGPTVEVKGPANGRWVGYLLIRSPRGSRVGLSARNGPIRAESFNGQLTIATTNGPIALRQISGTVTARAQNGPISLEGESGNISLETQNGPISVRLAGTEWEAGGLVAKAENGPLSVELPAQYRSGVEIQSSGHAPWSCRRECGARDESGERRAHLGDGPTHVRLSTVNGPVSVR
jgi:hypothetical protein